MPAMYDNLLNPSLYKILKTFKLDIKYVRAKGNYLWDNQEIRYLDFISQYGAVPFGYNPDFIWDALDEARRSQIPSLVQPSLPVAALNLANRLAECSPGDLCYSTFCQSGTEAVEAAIKLARSKTGREIIVSTSNSFHGKTLGALSATGKDAYQSPFRAPAPGFVRIPYNDGQALRDVLEQYKDQTAAFIVEPVQGEGGVIVARPGYLAEAQRLCQEYGVVFIVDEIQTGLGRTGRLFACEHDGIEPDIMLLAKAIGGGLVPLGVCLSSPRVWNDDFGMLHSSTFANNNLTCAAGTAVLQELTREGQSFIKEVKQKGDYLLLQAEQLARQFPDAIREVRGQGLMVGVEFKPLNDAGSYDMAYLADQGGFTALLAGYLLNVEQIRLAPFLNNSMTLRLEPPLTVTYEEIDYTMKALARVCQLMSYHDYASLYRYLFAGHGDKPGITDYRSRIRTVKSSPLKDEKARHRFAFVIHYPAPEDVVLNNPSFAGYSRENLYRFMQWQSQIKDPGVVCHMPAIRSRSGSTAEGWLIGVPLGGREIMSWPKNEVVDIIARAVDMGRDLGAGIVGLGALTSVVTRGGRAVSGRQVAITSGNSFTTIMAAEAVLLAARKMHVDTASACCGVVGANGSIGRACALMLSEKVSSMLLFGNPDHPGSSKNRLDSLTRDIMTYAWQRMRDGYKEGMSGWLINLGRLLSQTAGRSQQYLARIEAGEDLNLSLLLEICSYIGIACPIQSSLNIAADLPRCDLVIATSNSPEYLIFPADLRSGAVVCDVARPADVAPEVYLHRDDVLVIEGGLVQYPDDICFGPNLGYRDGVNLACLSETILLALEGDYQDYSIGNKLSLATMQYFRDLADKHGFGLAGLKMGNRELTDQDIERIYLNSIKLKQVENM